MVSLNLIKMIILLSLCSVKFCQSPFSSEWETYVHLAWSVAVRHLTEVMLTHQGSRAKHMLQGGELVTQEVGLCPSSLRLTHYMCCFPESHRM